MFPMRRPVAFKWWVPPMASVLALAMAAPLAAQVTAKSPSSAGEYSLYEISPFAGYQWFRGHANSTAKFDSGPALGFRVVEDFWKYVGLEQSLTVGFNDLGIRPTGLTQSADASVRNWTLALNPLLYLRPRTSKWRPFLTIGPAITWYAPEAHIRNTVPGEVPIAAELETKSGPAMIFGGGLKYNATPRIGVRFDVRGLWTEGQYLGLPRASSGPGTLYIPEHGTEKALLATFGIVFRLGQRTEEAVAPAVAAPTPTPTPTPAPVEIQIGGISGARDVCPGESVRLEVSASGWQPNQTPSYQWMIDGQPVSGATESSFNVPTTTSGAKSVSVRVSVGENSKTSDPVTVRVKDYSAPTVRFSLAQSSIPYGTKLPLDATAAGSECGGPTSINYSASEGSVSGNTFDSSSVAFDPANRLRQQTKVVHITATATDQKGGTGSASSDVTVTLSPEARRLDDIVFPAHSSRVNNCAKRLLLEQLTPMLRDDPNATVILIGHRDEREKGKAAAKLDRARALNAAAVLSAGTGICPQLELSRVKIGWVGSEQGSETKPLLCGTSTDVKERSGQAVKASDQRAPYRRVEVWFVPGGAAMPAGVTGLQEVPAADIQKLGCPK